MTTLRKLWRELLPLAWSDLNLALVEPAITATLTHLPDPRTNLAAIGIGKAVANVFESPIYKLLHAANALGRQPAARRALFRFMLLAAAALTLAFAVLLVPPIYHRVATPLLGISGVLATTVHVALACLLLWPAAIACRRYFQGLLIRGGFLQAVQWCATARLAATVVALAAGFAMRGGVAVGAVAMIGGAVVEAALLVVTAVRSGATRMRDDEAPHLPRDVRGVARYYWPLASSMLVVWGGRAVLIAIVARADDAELALAAWPAAWAIVLLVANMTRMVNQIAIRNRGRVPDAALVEFAATVGIAGVAILLAIAATPLVELVLGDPDLVGRARPVLFVCAAVPFFVALQNALQGLLIESGRTGAVNAASWAGTLLMLAMTFALERIGWSGATAAATATCAALVVETAMLRAAAGASAAASDPSRRCSP